MSAPHPALAPLDAPTLVEASAGTGKTYTITTYYVRAIIESGQVSGFPRLRERRRQICARTLRSNLKMNTV